MTEAKQTVERAWLQDVSSVPLQQALRHLDKAYNNFFNSRNGKHKGGHRGVPRFKRRSNQQSAEFTRTAFSVTDGEVLLTKVGMLYPIWSRPLPSDPSSVTVIKDCANRYFLSFVVEVLPIHHPAVSPAVGIDLGLKTFAVLTTGEQVESPDYSDLDHRVRQLQRKLARQTKGSNRWQRTKLRIARLHNRISDLQKDFLHKFSTRLNRENQAIVLEDLNVSGMVKNRKLAGAIGMQGWRMFRELCAAKAEKFDRLFQVVNRWEPTSQVCSECGDQWGKLDLKVRTIQCINCGTVHDRDENAAGISKKSGDAPPDLKSGCWREGQTSVLAHLWEASRIAVALAR